MSPKGLLLFPGAGGNKNGQTLVALDERLGLPVRRLNFDYREQNPGPRPPPRVPVLVPEVVSAAERVCDEWGIEPEELIIGGRSMGGRIASVAHAEGLACAGLLLLSYPLHPARKPETLRTEHFGAIKAPVLLVQGTKDPFGTPAEFGLHLAAIGPPVEIVWLDGANHQPKKHDVVIREAASQWITSLSR